MASLRTWFRGSSSTTSSRTTASLKPGFVASETALNGSGTAACEAATTAAEREAADMEDAMAAAGLIMNDDIEGAEAQLELRKDSSTFHLLALGVATFMKSILGFEKEIMDEAASRLSECETRAWADLKRAQKEAEKGAGGGYWYGRGAWATDASAGKIYPPGSEFALVHAEAQLMNAVVAVMHESLTEGLKGFYKLRKAFVTLDGIMEAEAKAQRQVQRGSTPGPPSESNRPRPSDDMMPGSFDDAEFADLEVADEKGSDSDADFVDASASLSGNQTPTGATEASRPGSAGATGSSTIEKAFAGVPSTSSRTRDGPNVTEIQSLPPLVSALEKTVNNTDTSLFTSTRDVFVHSGANMCFGILLLVISMVPPAFSRLLYIVGFKGDRDRGVAMLWQSTKFPNVNGAVAGLILLGYYNGLLAFADILPSNRDVEELAKPESEGGEIVGYPKERCTALLADMRLRYPESRLWKLEEARVLANTRRLREAIETLAGNSDSKMRQVTALNTFELSLNAMFAMDWPLARTSFLRCIELNEWSHTIYYYMVGCAELELYRDAYHASTRPETPASEEPPPVEAAGEAAQRHKKAAEGFFRKAPSVAGRKRFLARQMPFEVFVCRKLQKWEERAAALGVDLADAVGASPAMEMVYMWNGSKRMSPDLLERARTLVPWERCTATEDQVAKIREEKDEVGVQAVVDASLLRSLGRVKEARAALEPTLKLDRYVSTCSARARR